MDRFQPMRMSWTALLGRTVTVGLVVLLAGAGPTWLAAGWHGLRGLLLAAGIVLAATILSASLVRHLAVAGPSRAALAFVATGLGRLAMSLAIGAAAAWRYRPSAAALLTWLVILYVAMLLNEGAWLVRALRRHAASPPPGPGGLGRDLPMSTEQG
ncbi:MAG TPA: hypothetical protein VM031_06230 [Phycisphaerae bacterium]|nr:hypothetical protein [Phycisphaerae bacterium]